MKWRQMATTIRRAWNRFQRRVREIVNYFIGEFFCRRFHGPLFAGVGGIGGRDVFGRRRGEYYVRRCIECRRSWDKNGRPTPLTPSQDKACSEALGSSWVGGKPSETGVVSASGKIQVSILALTPMEVEQLLAIWIHNLTFAGDLISKQAEKSLRKKGLVGRLEGWAVVTEEGNRWIMSSGLGYKFEKKSEDVRP